MKISDLKHTTFDLVKMTLDKDDQKTAVINAIRRL